MALRTIAKWTGSADQRYALSFTHDGTYLYAGMYNYGTGIDQAEVVKLNSSMASQATWTSGRAGTQALLLDGSKVLAVFKDETTGYGALAKLTTALSEDSRWVGDSDEQSVNSVTSDSGYYYVGCSSSAAGKVIKIDKNALTKTDRLTGTNTEYIYAVLRFGSYLYVALRDSSTSKYLLWKINPTTMGLVDTLDPGITGATSGGKLVDDGTNIYWGLPVSPGVILKVAPLTLTETDRWAGATGENKVIALYHDSSYLYTGLSTSPGKMIKVSTGSMSSSDSWAGGTGEDYVYSTWQHGSYVYAALLTNPAIVAKIGVTGDFVWII